MNCKSEAVMVFITLSSQKLSRRAKTSRPPPGEALRRSSHLWHDLWDYGLESLDSRNTRPWP
jgi:hypothetical protein